MRYRAVFESMWSDDDETERYYRRHGRPISIAVRAETETMQTPIGFIEPGPPGQRGCELYIEEFQPPWPESMPTTFASVAEAKRAVRAWINAPDQPDLIGGDEQ